MNVSQLRNTKIILGRQFPIMYAHLFLEINYYYIIKTFTLLRFYFMSF